MATPVLRGLDTPIYQSWEQRWQPYRGGETTEVWRGTNLAKISALAQQYVNAGYGGSLRYEMGVATFTLSTSALDLHGSGSQHTSYEAIVDKWEVAVDQEKPEIFENQNFLSLVTQQDAALGTYASQQLIQAIKQAAGTTNILWGEFLSGLLQIKIVDVNGVALASGKTLGDLVTELGEQYVQYFTNDFFRGATSFLRGKYSLRHTTIAPSSYSSNVADFNVENIYTIAQLLSEAQNGGLWILPLPPYLAFKINAYPVPVTVPPNYQYGGLKLRSSATTMARGRIEIVTEYLIDTWPMHTYGLIGTPGG